MEDRRRKLLKSAFWLACCLAPYSRQTLAKRLTAPPIPDGPVCQSTPQRYPPTLSGKPDTGSAPAQDIADYSVALHLPGASGLMAIRNLSDTSRLTASISRHAILPNKRSDIWCYATPEAEAALNPTFYVNRGDKVSLTLENKLAEDTTIHWHGFGNNELNDGSGMYPVARDSERKYRFEVNARSGLYWYHAHPHDRTGAQVHAGLAGLIVVDDEDDAELRSKLGLIHAENDIPLLIQDKRISPGNRLSHEMGEDDWLGNRTLLNWTPEPVFDAKRELYRFRILNASNARIYRLAFVDAKQRVLPITLIGGDGGLLDRAYTLKDVFLAPAQRADILVDFSAVTAKGPVVLRSIEFDPMENDVDPSLPVILEHPHIKNMGEMFNLMRIDLSGQKRAAPRLPKTLSRLAALPAINSKQTVRTFHFHLEGLMWKINGRNYHEDHHQPRFTVARNSVEIWRFSNAWRSMPHPIHTHGFQFRVLSRKNSPPQIRQRALDAKGRTAQDMGWLDTVMVWPGETVDVVFDFQMSYPGTQTYMLHCHNLEHEDQGMMLNFCVA